MLTRGIKKDLLGRVMNIGSHVTALEGDAYIYGVAKPQLAELRIALERVRSAIAEVPEPDGPGARVAGPAMRPSRGD
jgi:hypothetical protein